MRIERILVPVDYSRCSAAALAWAADIGRRLGAMLDIVHVWDRPSYVSDVVLTRSDVPSRTSLIAMIQANAQRDLDEFLASVSLPADITTERRLISGDPASALLHELKQGRHGLVVVGTHGRTGLAHALLGSVAERLVRLAEVPVLTVPDPAAQMLRG